MAVVILIGLFVHNEKAYDQWIADKEDIYRVYRQWSANGSNVAYTPRVLPAFLAIDLPEIEMSSGLSNAREALLDNDGDKIYIEHVAMVDSMFFQVLAYLSIELNLKNSY